MMNASKLVMPAKGVAQRNNRTAAAKAPAMPKVHAARSVLAGQRLSARQPLRMTGDRRPVSVKAAVVEGEGGLQKVVLKSNEDVAEIYTFGGVCTSWTKNGKDVLYVRPDAKFDKSKPISGGIPHCWPQFGPGDMQVHGFARNLQWELTIATLDECVMTLVPTEESLKMWPHQFKVTQTISLKGGNLVATMNVENTDDKEFSFTGSYHTYFAVHDIADVKVGGLEGTKCLDRLTEKTSDVTEEVTIGGPVDSVYSAVSTTPLTLEVGMGRTISIGYSGWPDAVVWSPWTDMESCYREFVCVENAACDSVTVPPGMTWSASMSLHVTDQFVDPQLEAYCDANPEAAECLVYED